MLDAAQVCWCTSTLQAHWQYGSQPYQFGAQGARRVSFDQFVQAMGLVAKKKGMPVSEVLAALLESQGPISSGTKADYVKFHDDKVRMRTS